GHMIFVYSADLHQACVEHVNVAGLVLPGIGFAPTPGVVYWLSIQAEVGATVGVGPNFNCILTSNTNQALKEFWGWHTTHPTFHQIDDAYIGILDMACNGDWLYNWLHHLHWSQPPYVQCADDPTQSIDMAFELYQLGDGAIWSQPAVTFGLRGIDIHSDVDFNSTPQDCTCRGDLDSNGKVNGIDIQLFVDCYLTGCAPPGCVPPTPGTPLTCPCLCADMNADGAVTAADIPLFVARLLTLPGTLCP